MVRIDKPRNLATSCSAQSASSWVDLNAVQLTFIDPDYGADNSRQDVTIRGETTRGVVGTKVCHRISDVQSLTASQICDKNQLPDKQSDSKLPLGRNCLPNMGFFRATACRTTRPELHSRATSAQAGFSIACARLSSQL